MQRLVNILGQVADPPGLAGYGSGLLQVRHGFVDLGLDLIHSLTDLDSAPFDGHGFSSFLGTDYPLDLSN
jgi:hypothetical protein